MRAAIFLVALLVLSSTSAHAQMKLYVGNLSYQSSNEDDLRELFSQAGTVVSVEVVMNKETGRPEGVAFVVMATREEGQKAIEQFNGKEFGGRNLIVTEAKGEGPNGRSNQRRPGFGAPPTVSKVSQERTVPSKPETPKQNQNPNEKETIRRAPIAGLDVKLGRTPGDSAAARTTTDGAGHFSFSVQPAGSYTITVASKEPVEITVKGAMGGSITKSSSATQANAKAAPAPLKVDLKSDGKTAISGTVMGK
jgi:RNA recognition motif-containing protein